jgi:hypothetical protein
MSRPPAATPLVTNAAAMATTTATAAPESARTNRTGLSQSVVGNGAAAVKDQRAWDPVIVASANTATEKHTSTLPPSRPAASGIATEPHNKFDSDRAGHGPPSRDQSEFFAATLEHIVRQLDILTQTVTVMEERLTHVEDVVAHAKPGRGSAGGVFAPRHAIDNNNDEDDDDDDDDDEGGMVGVHVP